MSARDLASFESKMAPTAVIRLKVYCIQQVYENPIKRDWEVLGEWKGGEQGGRGREGRTHTHTPVGTKVTGV